MFFNFEKYYSLYKAFDFSVTRIKMTNEGKCKYKSFFFAWNQSHILCFLYLQHSDSYDYLVRKVLFEMIVAAFFICLYERL